MLSAYPACFFKEKDGAYSVIFPDLDLATCGSTLNESLEMAVDCLAGFLYTAQMDGDDIPAPSDISSVDMLKVAAGLDSPDYDGFVNIVTVDVAAYAKKHFEKSVKKTLTIPAWLNTLAEEKHINFSKTLQHGLKEQLGV